MALKQSIDISDVTSPKRSSPSRAKSSGSLIEPSLSPKKYLLSSLYRVCNPKELLFMPFLLTIFLQIWSLSSLIEPSIECKVKKLSLSLFESPKIGSSLRVLKSEPGLVTSLIDIANVEACEKPVCTSLISVCKSK